MEQPLCGAAGLMADRTRRDTVLRLFAFVGLGEHPWRCSVQRLCVGSVSDPKVTSQNSLQDSRAIARQSSSHSWCPDKVLIRLSLALTDDCCDSLETLLYFSTFMQGLLTMVNDSSSILQRAQAFVCSAYSWQGPVLNAVEA